jgi:hypothetical protein
MRTIIFGCPNKACNGLIEFEIEPYKKAEKQCPKCGFTIGFDPGPPVADWPRHEVVEGERFLKRVCKGLAILALMTAGPSLAQAEAVPLLELSRDFSGLIVGAPTPTSTTLELNGNMAESGPDTFIWNATHSLSDVGVSYFAPPEIIAGAQKVLNVAKGYYQIGNSGQNTGLEIVTSPPYLNPCPTWACQVVLVPDLRDYYITAIERVVESMSFEHRENGHVARVDHTVRYWGELKPPLPGDYNRDLTVDAADYLVWRKQIADFGPLPNGSGVGIFAGMALPEDYAYWRANFGRSFPSGHGSVSLASGIGSQSIPEPATVLLIAIAFTLLPRDTSARRRSRLRLFPACR